MAFYILLLLDQMWKMYIYNKSFDGIFLNFLKQKLSYNQFFYTPFQEQSPTEIDWAYELRKAGKKVLSNLSNLADEPQIKAIHPHLKFANLETYYLAPYSQVKEQQKI